MKLFGFVNSVLGEVVQWLSVDDGLQISNQGGFKASDGDWVTQEECSKYIVNKCNMCVGRGRFFFVVCSVAHLINIDDSSGTSGVCLSVSGSITVFICSWWHIAS